MANETHTFQLGETVPVWCYVQDWSDTYADPTSIEIEVWLPSGTQDITSTAMTKSATGKYVYYYASESTDTAGFYRVKVTVVDGTGGTAKTTIIDGGFRLQ